MKSYSLERAFAGIVSTTFSCIVFSILAWTQAVQAAEQKVLFVNVHDFSGYWNGDAVNVFITLTNAGAVGTYVDLVTGGEVRDALASNSFDQVWLFDLSFGEDAFTNDWQAIANWYNARSQLPIICDGRILSSYWNGKWLSEGLALSQNYYDNLKSAGGGLVLGTDHGVGGPDLVYEGTYALGVNSLNSLLGLNPFVGQFSAVTMPTDTNSPLMTMPNNLQTISDDSTTSQCPFGLQPGGKMLYTIAWHSGNRYTPGISSTIAPGMAGYRLWITSPPSNSVFAVGQIVTFSAQETNAAFPTTISWVSDRDGLLGTGTVLNCSNLSIGVHAITVTGVDSGNHVSMDSRLLTIVGSGVLNIAHAVELWWNSAMGLTYQVQWSAEVDPTNWHNLGNPVAGDGNLKSVFDSTRASARRFYRIVQP